MAKYTDQYELEVQTENAQKALNAVKVGFAAVSAAAAGVTAVIAKLTVDGLDMVDSQAKLARSLDATADGVRAVQIAAGDAGIDSMEASLNRLNRRLGAAANGNAEYAKTVDSLNLNLEELRNMDVDERVAAIADAVRDSGMASDQAARALQKLGFEQANANDFFRQGGDAIRAARQEVIDYGLSLSEVDSTMVENANDSWERVGRQLEVVQQRLAVGLAPIIEYVSGLLNDSAKEAGGFREIIDNAVESGVRGFAFVANAVDGVIRVFEVAGKTIAVFALTVKSNMLLVANYIAGGPTRAVVNLIELMNNLPGIDIDTSGLTNFEQSISQELANTNAAVRIGIQDIQDTLMEPLAGDNIVEEFLRIRDAAREAAQAQVDARNPGSGPGGTTPPPPSGPIIETIKQVQKGVEQELANSRDRIRKAQEAAQLSGFQGLQRELKAIELEEKRIAEVAKERIRAQFGEDADSAEAISKIKAIEQARQDAIQARQRAARQVQQNEEAAINAEEERQAAIEQSQRTFVAGWKNAFEEYKDAATNSAKTAEQLFTQATGGMEDAIVDFVKTGKFEFRSLIADMLETLLRSEIQQMMSSLLGGTGFSANNSGSAIVGGLSNLFGGFFATGGMIPAGRFGVVGENGPELVSGPANVDPNVGGANITYNINAVDAASFKELVSRDPAFMYAVSEQGRRRAPLTRR